VTETDEDSVIGSALERVLDTVPSSDGVSVCDGPLPDRDGVPVSTDAVASPESVCVDDPSELDSVTQEGVSDTRWDTLRVSDTVTRAVGLDRESEPVSVPSSVMVCDIVPSETDTETEYVSALAVT
jgi:hypothetical protein